MHQFGQLLVHLLSHPTNVEVACAEMTNMTILTPSGNTVWYQAYTFIEYKYKYSKGTSILK